MNEDKTAIDNNKEVHYEYEKPKRNQKKDKSKKKSNKTSIIIFIFFLAFVGTFYFLAHSGFLKLNTESTTISVGENEIVYDKEFATGLRMASLNRYDEAISNFERLNLEELSDDDKEIILHTYLKADKAQEALNLDRDFAESIIQEYLSNGELERLKELDTDSKTILFEIAVLDSDYEMIIDLKDDVEKDVRRANAIANAYYQMDEKEEAVNFTSLMVFDGINMWEAGISYVDEPNKEYIPSTPSHSSTNVFSSLFIVVVIIASLIFLYFYLRKKRKGFSEYPTKEKKKKNKKDKKRNSTEQENKEIMEIEEKHSDDNNEKEKKKSESENEKYSYQYEDD